MRSEYDATLEIEPEEELVSGRAECAAGPRLKTRFGESPVPLHKDEFTHLDDGTGDFDGERLRHFRIRCGMEIEDIARITKISPTYLGFIEKERFADLPDSVYVRGFVTAYANCVGLEGKGVAASYMKRFDEGAAEIAARGDFSRAAELPSSPMSPSSTPMTVLHFIIERV